MTRAEAKNFLEQNWWQSLGIPKPGNIEMIVGELYKEDSGNYWFNCYRLESGDELPANLNEWEIWLVGKDGKSCGPPIFS